jgi:hypothetical protein
VSKHWKLDSDRDRWTQADAHAPPAEKSWRSTSWPDGATAGLVLVAAACLAVGALLYQVAGPRHPVEEGVARR